MKKKLKLAFEELERELALVSDVELVQVVGGFSSGNNAGLINHSFEDSVDFLTDPGTGTNIESEQDLFYGSKIALNETTFNAYLNNYTTSSSSSSGSSGGYGSTGLSSTGYYLDEVIINSTGSTSTGHGYDHFSSGNQNGSGYNYSTGNGSTGSGSAGGDWGPGSGSPTIPANPNIPNDPWKQAIYTNKTTEITYGENGHTLYFKEVKLVSENGNDILALEVYKVVDNKTNTQLSTIPDDFKSNCSGLAFTGGKYWITDALNSAHNEIAKFENMLNSNTLYSQVNGSTIANVAVIWWTDKSTGERFIAHSAIVNGIGSYTQKTDYASIQDNVSFTAFTKDHIPTGDDTNLYSYEVVYYKNNF
ncbi:hypothetical protein ABE545_23400 [Sphingobacterium faecium]|jgi:hypothetical protein|uniref:hypothetical protein n=1 Tax=Sphingobacterium faecium TaxID=34087 RepID=UPI003208686F